jgi:16S rRNA (guanine527-N7)-methyltransferase
VARAGGDSLAEVFEQFPGLIGRPATAGERQAFERYADLLMQWNRTHHLTAFRTKASIGKGLFCDSLLFRSLIPSDATRIADVGAGPGIPGIPLRIVDPRLALTLVESRRKPVSFLYALTRHIGLDDVDVRHGRAEELPEQFPELEGAFDAVLVRSVRINEALCRGLMRILRNGGKLIAAGPPSAEMPRLASWPGPGRASWETVTLGKMSINRMFLVVRKES